MPALHIRDLDDAVIDALKARAARHHRSLQGELKTILEQAAQEAERDGGKRRRKLRLRTVSVGGPRSFSRDEIYEDDGR